MPILAVAAVAGAAGVATGVVAASTVVMAGLAATVVGKLTKSKELSQIGAGLSLGGGLASVATSIFGAAEGTAAAGTAVEGVTSAAAEGITGVAGTAETAGAAIESAVEGIGAAASEGATAGLSGVSSAATGVGETGGLLSAGSSGGFGIPSVPGMAEATGAASGAMQGVTGAIAAPATTTSSGISGWWNGLSEATKNKLLQVGGQAASGLMEGWTAEQKLAFERERQRLEQERYSTSMRNASAQPVVRFQKVNPVTQGTGLLTPTRG